jgi:uncharacterized membrane protein
MSNKFENKHSDDPNSLTTEDREVLKKTDITPTDVKDALTGNEANKAANSGMRAPEIGFKLIFGGLLVVGGILIAVTTSLTLFGIIIGAIFVIVGFALPFSSIGNTEPGRGNHAQDRG